MSADPRVPEGLADARLARAVRTRVEPGRLILEDSPGCFWLFGLFFLLLGSLPIAGLFGLFAEPWKVRGWEAPAAVLLGLAAVAAGLYVVYTSPRTRVIFDVTRGRVSVSRRGLLRREDLRFGLDELRAELHSARHAAR